MDDYEKKIFLDRKKRCNLAEMPKIKQLVWVENVPGTEN